MSAPRIILASLPSFCQKLSKLVYICRSSDKNNFAQFFDTRCIFVHTSFLRVDSYKLANYTYASLLFMVIIRPVYSSAVKSSLEVASRKTTRVEAEVVTENST